MLVAGSPWFSTPYLVLAVILFWRARRVLKGAELLGILREIEIRGSWPAPGSPSTAVTIREVEFGSQLVAFLALAQSLASVVLYGSMLAFHRGDPATHALGPLLVLSVHIRNLVVWALCFAAVEVAHRSNRRSVHEAKKRGGPRVVEFLNSLGVREDADPPRQQLHRAALRS
jgi:hypothetical protein